MKNLFAKFMMVAALFMFVSCDEDEEPKLVDPPTEADAAFTYEATAESDNILEFTASVDGFNRYVWDLGNGENVDEAKTVTGTYPNAGSYEVTLTVFNDGGSASSTQTVEIAETDPTLLDNPLYNLLTGGIDGGGSKTWAVDSASAVHFGVGPNPVSDEAGDYPEYYQAQVNEKSGNGMYDDRYTFSLEGFGFDMQTNGDVFIRADQAENFPGSEQSPIDDDFIAPFTPSNDLTWNLNAPDNADTTLSISGDGFIGYYTGTNTYKVITLTENELFISYEDANDPALLWYIRLVPEGYNSNPDGEPEVVTATLPLGFETQTPTLTSFEGNEAAIIDNPDASGLNTSAKVLQLFKGFQGYSGSLFDLENPIAIQEGTTATLKVWAPQTGVFRFKLENTADGGQFVEIDADVTVAEEWVELTFDLSSGAGLELDRVVLFPSWDVPDAGTFYVDDIDVQ